MAAGTVVARQFYDSGSNEAVSWELADASGQSIRMTDATGGYTDVDSGGAELDALGNNVGTHGSLSDPRNSEGEVSPANRSPISAEALCDKGGVAGPCWLVNMINRGQTMGSKGSDLPIEMLGDSHPASLSRHPFYFAFYRNSIEAAEDEGRWIQTDWDVTYEENLSGTNDSSVTIIGRVNAMTFIPPTSLPGPEGAQCPDPPCAGLGGTGRCGVNPVTGRPGVVGIASGLEGEVRPGVRGGGFFDSPRKGDRLHKALDISFGSNTVETTIINGPLKGRNQNMQVGSIVAILGGVVKAVGYTGTAEKDKESYGNFVEIDHGGGYTSYYAHLGVSSKGLLKVGDPVAGGQLIGIGGQTGNAVGQPASESHLHLIVRKNGVPIDPLEFLNSICPPGVSMAAPQKR